ncbi:hypothetical protein NLX71_01355 [Paenibacillus sp. MZ04-78.2]|nr:hypothetical protein [Paenibacillus sp. MZ04-78.2]MCP3771967.1 hypothetical protein [Paenibacillus sp. MZ04-78.2]
MSVHHLMEDIVRGCLKELTQSQEHLADLPEKAQSDIMAIVIMIPKKK